jgi:DNA-binding MarR family transcriptional regulator
MEKCDPTRAWRALIRAEDAVLRAIEADLERAGQIPLSTYDVLLELSSAPERRLRMQDLASRTVLSRTRVSRLVDELVAQGLVERRPDPSDGRASFAMITDLGRRRLRRAAPRYLAGIEAHFTSMLSDEERDALTAVLERVVAAHRG